MKRLLPLVVVTATLITVAPRAAHAIPAWARRYNMDCSGCHTPVVPRLNGFGIAFKWAGYRTPDDIGTKLDVNKIEQYLAAKIEAAYDYVTSSGVGRSQDGFSVPSASLFAAGPFGKQYAGYLEFEREPGGTTDLIAQITGVWGGESRWSGFRVGTGHALMTSGGVAGFDRPTGISTPLAYDVPNTDAIPMRLAGDFVGVEGFMVTHGKNRTGVQLVNSVVVAAGDAGAAVTNRDVAVTNQYMYDDAGSGVGLAAYFGSALGLVRSDSLAGTRYVRLGATANKIFNRGELSGGYVYARDRAVPDTLTGTVLSSPVGTSYWLQAQMTTPTHPLTLFGRYEWRTADRARADAEQGRYVLGATSQLTLPEYLKWSLELTRDTYRDVRQPRRDAIALRLQAAF